MQIIFFFPYISCNSLSVLVIIENDSWWLFQLMGKREKGLELISLSNIYQLYSLKVGVYDWGFEHMCARKIKLHFPPFSVLTTFDKKNCDNDISFLPNRTYVFKLHVPTEFASIFVGQLTNPLDCHISHPFWLWDKSCEVLTKKKYCHILLKRIPYSSKGVEVKIPHWPLYIPVKFAINKMRDPCRFTIFFFFFF